MTPFKYDIFISYRHGGLDSKVAERLHRLLETYRVPAKVAKKSGKKRISRVFRDREELPTSHSLSTSIEDALAASEFLIVICSRRLPESAWCMREIDLFKEWHGVDHIIALLIDGEPDESFPTQIRTIQVNEEMLPVEPLAADIRASSTAKSLKLLNTEKLRLLAPVLGCAYDELKQRHRERKIRRMITVAAAAMAFLLAFGSFSTYQYIRIAQEMQQKLYNQSHVLAEYARDVQNNGDPELAALLSLSALPKNLKNPERPFVPEAATALADALGTYDAANGFKPYKTIELPAPPQKTAISKDGRFGAVLYPFEVAVIALSSGKVVFTAPTNQTVLTDMVFLESGALLFTGAEGLSVYDVHSGEVAVVGGEATAIALSGNGAIAAAVYRDNDYADIYSISESQAVKTGTASFDGKRQSVPSADWLINPRGNLLALNEDGTRLAVSFDDGSLAVADIETNDWLEIAVPSGAIHYEGAFNGDLLAFSCADEGIVTSAFCVADLMKKEILQTIPLEGVYARISPAQSGGFYFTTGQLLNYTDGRDYKPQASFPSVIEAISAYDNMLIAADTDGGYYFVNEDLSVTSYSSSYICNFIAISEYYALTGGFDSTSLRILRKAEGSGRTLFKPDGAARFDEARENADGTRYMLYDVNELRVYDDGGALICQTKIPNAGFVTDQQYDKASGSLMVLYDDALRIYDADGAIAAEASNLKSVFYAPYGISAFASDGSVKLYAPNGDIAYEAVTSSADFAAYCGGLFVRRGDTLYFNDGAIGDYTMIGAAAGKKGMYFAALSNGNNGSVYMIQNSTPKKLYDFTAKGRAEAYFIGTGGAAVISPAFGTPAYYNASGEGSALRGDAFMTGAIAYGASGEFIAEYLSASGTRFADLMTKNAEKTAELPGYMDVLHTDEILLRSGNELRAVTIKKTAELMSDARTRLDKRALTDAEKQIYNAR